MTIARCNRQDVRMVQIHPLRRCNLACRHCYTESGPLAEEAVPDSLVVRLVEDAAAAGYTWLAVSGGEPLLWRGLLPALDRARAAGLQATLTTNASLVTPRLAHALAERVGFVAVSVDGPATSHDALRGAGSHRRMEVGLSRLRDAGIQVGLLWTLTQYNAHELDAVYTFARAAGAAFVQIHPLEGVGSAARELVGAVPEADELLVTGLLAAEVQGEVPIYLDASPSDTLAANVMPSADADAPLAELVNPLVLRPDGLVVPGNYALAELALGSLYDAPLPDLTARWRAHGMSRWRALVARTVDEAGQERRLVNFGASLRTAARSPAA